MQTTKKWHEGGKSYLNGILEMYKYLLLTYFIQVKKKYYYVKYVTHYFSQRKCNAMPPLNKISLLSYLFTYTIGM